MALDLRDLGRWAGSQFGAVTGTVDEELVGTVGKTVEGGVGEERVGGENAFAMLSWFASTKVEKAETVSDLCLG